MNNLKDKNILVTGGTGFVGSHLVEELVKQKANVITTYQTLSPRLYFIRQGLDKKVTMVNVDICDFDKVFDVITKFQIDFIFHLAAQALVDVAYNNPKKTFESNILGTVNVLEATRLFSKIKGVIVASSDKAYGKLSSGKYKETDPLRGDHPYESSKSAADLIANTYFKTYHLPVVITRFGNIYGEGDLNFSRIIPGVIKAIIKNEELIVRSDGKYVRDYLYVKDVVDGYLLLAKNIEKVKGEAFNLGSTETLSVIELIKTIEKTLHKKIDYKIMNTAKNEISHQSLDYSKINKGLKWKPKRNLVKSIKNTYKWYKKIL